MGVGRHIIKMKKKFLLIVTSLMLALTSCRHEPSGFEISINRMKILYSQGEIKEFTFIDKGSWILGELTEEVLASKKHADNINHLINQKTISKEVEFRYMAKVISLEGFVADVKETTGKFPVIRRIE